MDKFTEIFNPIKKETGIPDSEKPITKEISEEEQEKLKIKLVEQFDEENKELREILLKEGRDDLHKKIKEYWIETEFYKHLLKQATEPPAH